MKNTFNIKNKIITLMIFLFATLPLIYSQNWIPLDEIDGPLCVALNEETGETFPLSPANSRYNVIITDGFAKIELLQTFVNDLGSIGELVYVFPLPHEGSVHGMTMQYQDSIYLAKIYEKEEAKMLYNEALIAGLVAALLIQERPNIFTQKIANIAFGDTAYIKIDISLPLKYRDGEYELAVPTMIADRYMGFTNPGSQGDVWNPPANRNGQSLQFNVLFQTGFPISQIGSPTHPIYFSNLSTEKEILKSQGLIDDNSIVVGSDPAVARLATFQTYPNKDYILRFKRTDTNHDFTFASYWDQSKSEGTFALQLFPDRELFAGDRPDLELVILMDVSGSQGGWPLEKEKEIVRALLNKVNASDNILLLSFSTVINWAFTPGQAVPATAANIAVAEQFVGRATAGGGTELLSAVTTTLNIPIISERKRIYVFLTDGFITNEAAILTEIQNHPTGPTIFTFGAGDNLNRYFLDRAAEVGNGVSFVVTSNEVAGPFVDAAWEKIESPQFSNISFNFKGLQTFEIIKPASDKLYIGQPYILFGKYSSGGPFSLTLNAFKEGAPFSSTKNMLGDVQGSINSVVPQIWARQKIRELSLEQGSTDDNKNAIIDVSLEYQVLSKYTAFLAINPISIDEYDGELLSSPIGLYDELFERGGNLKGLLAEIKLKLNPASMELIFPQGISLRKIEVFDLLGRLVYTYFHASSTETDNAVSTSVWIWNGRLKNGSLLKRGYYILKIVTNKGVEMRRIHWKL